MDRIEISPGVCNGKPVVRGTRITVQSVLSYFRAGDRIEDVLAAHPGLTREDVLACVDHGRRMGELPASSEASEGRGGFKFDRDRIEIGLVREDGDDVAYWLGRPPAERIAGVEFLRRQFYSYGAARREFRRFLEIA